MDHAVIRSAREGNPIQDKSFAFAVEMVHLCQILRDQKDFVLSTQLLKAGTSIGANVEEALAGQTRKDFEAKMAIASKEAREARYWLRLVRESGTVAANLDAHIRQADELVRLLTAIVKTSQQKET